jgi:hypothetical protein
VTGPSLSIDEEITGRASHAYQLDAARAAAGLPLRG